MEVMNMANSLVSWVLDNTEDWKDNRDNNYLEAWKRYERLWRGVWDGSDKQRDSERSRIISPALQQAIENHTSEIEEAIFGQGGNFFTIEDDMQDMDKRDVEYIQAYMKENFKKNKIRKSIGDVILLSAIYGTGIGEIVTKEIKELVPATKPIDGMDAVAVGVEEKKRVIVGLNPISPQNFIIDPNAKSIEEALGVAIEEFVSAHTIAQKVKDGVYKDTDVNDDSSPDQDLEVSWIDQEYEDDKVRVLRYYGLVPKHLLDASDTEGEVEELFPEDTSELMEEYGDLVEAIVVIADNNKLLKAELSPYMMQDRPIVAYQDDTVPNRFWGRGVAEKGYNMQMGVDAQLRSHLDSLALTTVPMMAMDATRLPRGSKFEVRPGKTILTNGNPAEILQAFKFGQTDGSNIAAAQEFERMLYQATGTADTASMQAQPVGGEISIQLSSVIKKNKRTLVNFQDNFLIPFVEKAAWRFMQFDPENFPVKDFKFVPSSTLGMMAREVEQLQFINLLKTLGPDSPLTPVIMKGVISNSSLPNKEEMLAQLEQSSQPNPQQQQIQQMAMEMQVRNAQADLAKKEADIKLTDAKTINEIIDAQTKPMEVRARVMAAISTNLPNNDDKLQSEFDRRVKIAELMLKEKDINQNAEVVKQQMQNSLDKKTKM